MEAINDLDPQLANCRAFWLGRGAEDRQEDDGLGLFRSGLPHEELNGVMRVAPGLVIREVGAGDLADWIRAYSPSFGLTPELLGPVIRLEEQRGIGAAMTAAALRAGQERGRRIGTLQASSMGRPVYLRMGFQVVAQYRKFTLPTAR